MRVYQSPGRRFYVQYSGFGSLYYIRDSEFKLPFPIGWASGLPEAIRECDRAYRRSLV